MLVSHYQFTRQTITNQMITKIGKIVKCTDNLFKSLLVVLKDIYSSLNEIFGSEELSLVIQIDFPAISNLKLELTMEKIKMAISKENKIPIDLVISKSNGIEILINKDYYIYITYKEISGIKTVARCVVNEDKPSEYSLIIEGMGFLQVLGIQ